MNKTTSKIQSKAVTTAALLAALLATGACSGNKAIDSGDELTAITIEKVPNATDIAEAKKVADEAGLEIKVNSKTEIQKDTPSTIAGLEDTIALGKYLGAKGALVAKVANTFWKLVEQNQATVSLRSRTISALPSNAQTRAKVAGFQGPVIRKFQASLKNLAGYEVVRYDYLISFFHSGNVNGRGKFIQNLSVIHRGITVLPGFNLEVDLITQEVMNSGTEKNPVAVIPGEIRWRVKNVLTNIRRSNAFYVHGDGRLQIVSSDREVKQLH